MNEPIDPRLLIAFADGELAPEQRRAVEQYLASHPEARRAVEGHQRLTRAAQRVVRTDTPPVPRQLRSAVEEILSSPSTASHQLQMTTAPPTEPEPETAARPARRWLPLAAAAAVLLLIGAGGILLLSMWQSSQSAEQVNQSPGPLPQPMPPEAFDGTLSPILVAEVTRVHVKCSRILNHFLSPEFGQSLAELPAPAEKHLGRSGANIPDLSSMNYEFNGAGPCNVPGARTLHLLYRNRSDPAEHISLFIQPDDGHLKVDSDVLHTAAGPDAQHPMLVWRSGGLLYYIVGDTFDPTNQTAATLTGRL